MTTQGDTIAKCVDCERIYAAYYTSEGDISVFAGGRCPNCGSDRLHDARDA
jgi:DNA-directed RNA polymerase subunit RPC12/RpoP